MSFARPGRQVSRYALRQNRSAFLLVFSEAGESEYRLHDPTVHRQLLRTRFASDGWEVPEILAWLAKANHL